jgi:hypothetical protein
MGQKQASAFEVHSKQGRENIKTYAVAQASVKWWTSGLVFFFCI